MRVLIVTQRLPYAPNRGDRLRAYHQIRQLRRMGWAVDVLALVHDREEASHASDLESLGVRVGTARVPHLRNMAVGLLSLPSQRPLTLTLLSSPRVEEVLQELASEPDVVLACSSSMAALALASPLARLPLVVDFVDVDSEKWRALAERSRWPMSWVYRRENRTLAETEAQVARVAHTALVTTTRESDALRALAPDVDVRVLPNGIDLDYFNPPPDVCREPRVVFTGVLNYAPNADAAIWLARDIWPLVRRRCPGARLDLVGASPTAAVRALQDSSQGVTVTGSVPDVRPFLWRASVAAAPLRVARGVQNKVLEAAAAGLGSVVTSAVKSGLPDPLASRCPVADTPEAFAGALVEALGQPPVPSSWRAAVGNLSWHHVLAPLDSCLHAAASSSH